MYSLYNTYTVTVMDVGLFYARTNSTILAIECFRAALEVAKHALDNNNGVASERRDIIATISSYHVMLGSLLMTIQDTASASVHFETALSNGYMDATMRRYFAHGGGTIASANSTETSKLGRFILRKMARKGGGNRHRWLMRKEFTLALATVDEIPTSNTPAGMGMKTGRTLGSKVEGNSRAGHGDTGEQVESEFSRMQGYYDALAQEEGEDGSEGDTSSLLW